MSSRTSDQEIGRGGKFEFGVLRVMGARVRALPLGRNTRKRTRGLLVRESDSLTLFHVHLPQQEEGELRKECDIPEIKRCSPSDVSEGTNSVKMIPICVGPSRTLRMG